MCERCNALDGREVREYALKGTTRTLCLPCALLTAEVHDISPKPEPPEAPEAEAVEAQEPEATEAAGEEEAKPPEAPEAEAKRPRRRR